jgi:serine/threonine protein kinase
MGDERRRGRWVLDRPAYEGSWVVVWRAHAHDDLGELAAIKLPISGAPPWVGERLRRERDVLVTFKHPGAVGLLDWGEDPDVPWLALEWLPDPAAEARGAATPDADPSLAAAIRLSHLLERVGVAAGAVAALHARGFVHGDIRAEHLRLNRDGEVRLIDFSASQPSGSLADGVPDPHYLPPERFLGETRLLPAADVYALGVVLHDQLGGRPTGPGDRRTTKLDPGESAPATLRDLVRRATEPEPHRRATAAMLVGVSAPVDADRPDSAGRYEIRGVVRRGRSGMVYRGFDPALHCDVAVQFGVAPARLERHARAANLDDAGLVRVLDHGPSGDGCFVVSALVIGVTLQDWFAEKRRIPWVDVVRHGVRLGRTLSHAHEHGLVHGALTAEDVLIDREGQALIAGLSLGPGGPVAADVRGLASVLREISEGAPLELLELLDRAAGPAPPASMALFVDELRAFRQGVRRRGPASAWYLLGAVAAVVVAVAVIGVPGWSRRQFEREADDRLTAVEAEISAKVAEGDLIGADRSYAAWAAEAKWIGAPSFFDGRLRQAVRWQARGDADAAVRAVSEAYVEAPDAARRSAALVVLGRLLRQRWEWAGLESLLNRLESMHAPELASPEVQRWRQEIALARHTPPAEVAAGVDALLARLGGHARRLLVEADDLAALGTDRAVVLRGGRPVGVARFTGMGVVWERSVAAVAPGGWRPVGGATSRLIAGGPTPGLYLVRDQEFSLLASMGGAVTAGWRADLDADGVAEVYLGLDDAKRPLARLTPGATDGEPWRSEAPGVTPFGEGVTDLFVADVLYDGHPQLVVAAGGDASEVRVLRRTAQYGDHGREFEIASRVRLGAVRQVLPMPRAGQPTQILAVAGGRSATALGAGAAGVYLLSWDGERLGVRDVLATPIPCQSAIAGDFDGNGTGDAAIRCGDDAVVVTTGADGKLASGVLRGVTPRLAVDIDADSRDELVVTQSGETSGAVWVMGGGTEKIPVPPLAVPVLPPEGDAAVVERFARAEELLAFGLPEEAIRALLALGTSASPGGPAALGRAAAMLALHGRCHDAEAIQLRLADADGAAWRPLVSAADCASHEARFGDEVVLRTRLASIAAAPATVRSNAERRVREMQADALDPGVSWAFSDGFPADLSPLDALGARTVTGQGLRFGGVGTDLLSVPVHWDGRAFSVEVSLDLERVERGGALVVRLVSAQDSVSALGVGIEGGPSLFCDTGDGRRPLPKGERVAAGEARRGVLRLGFDGATWTCAASGDLVGSTTTSSSTPVGRRPVPGDYQLIVSLGSSGTSSMVSGVLRRVSLRGLVPRPVPDDPLTAARRRLVGGLPALVRDDLALPRGAVERAIVIDDLGGDVVAELRPASRDLDALVPWVRLRRARSAPWLRGSLPPAVWRELFDRAWTPLATADPADPEGIAALVEDLGVVSVAGDPDRASRLVALRGEAHARIGQWAAARQDHRDAVAWAVDPDVRTASLVSLAALDLRDGDRDGAIAGVARAIAESPNPLWWSDRMRVRPDLAGLRDDPRWEVALAAE